MSVSADGISGAPTAFDFQATTIDGVLRNLSDYRGRVLLIVNVASRCGFTPQYADLEYLFRKYRERGLVVLGFPCDQFAHQEPGSDAEIDLFCRETYNVTFPMFSKIDVNGPSAHPLFVFLKAARRGFLGSAAIKWNFTKFLVGRGGDVIKRYASRENPRTIAADIETLLSPSRLSR